jgi:hypothetical protein
MKLFKLFFFPQLALFILASYGGSSGGGGGGTSKLDVVLDSELTRAERGSLNNSIALLEKLRIESCRVSGFSQIF